MTGQKTSTPRRALSASAGVWTGFAALLLAACAAPLPRPDGNDLTADTALQPRKSGVAKSEPPPDIVDAAQAPRPRDTPKLERYSVVVADVEIRELLFAMARDAKINVDVDPRIQGRVTINAIDQTLPQILNRLARQVDLRYEFDGKTLLVQADLPYVHQYSIDYVNMARESKSVSSIATEIAAASGNLTSGGAGSGGGGDSSNNSTTKITITSSNHFWESVVRNVAALLGVQAVGLSAEEGGPAAAQAAAAAPAPSAAPAAPPASPGASAGAGANPAAPGSSAPASAPAPAAGPSPAMAAASARAALNGITRAVIASPETGTLTVRATQREHERIQAMIDKMLHTAHRQVLIEATIVEVQLSDEFQQGVNWSKMNANGAGWSLSQQPLGTTALPGGTATMTGPGGIIFPTVPPTASGLVGGATTAGSAVNPSMGVLSFLNSGSHGNVGLAVSMLQSFGKVKVLSSPKLSVLNNQTAMLKVVDNLVYFTIGVNITPATTPGGTATITYTSTANTLPVGFVMSVTPQIDDAGAVTINLRPTISRVIDYKKDPNPALANANTVSLVPEIQTREIESVMKVENGDIAVMGGLMQESVKDQRDQIPGAGSIPILGNLFRYVDDQKQKTELVIFLRPTVVRDASLEGDYAAYKDSLPDAKFFDTRTNASLPREWAQ